MKVKREKASVSESPESPRPAQVCPECGGVNGHRVWNCSLIKTEGGKAKIERLVLSIATNLFTTESLPSGKDVVAAINERDALLKVRDAAEQVVRRFDTLADTDWHRQSIGELSAALAATNSGTEAR